MNELLNKRRLYWTLQIGGWMLYAIFQIVFSVLASTTQTIRPQRVVFLLFEALLCLLITQGFRYVIMEWKWMSLNLVRIVPRVVFGVFLLAIVLIFLRMPVSIALRRFNPGVDLLPETIISGVITYSLIFFLWSVMYFVYNYFESYNKSLKLEASIKEIELSNLKSQLNPHFIFNALNSIRALVDENPPKSKQAINQLSNILRNSLVTEKRGLTSFDDELKVVKDYLGLESIRFEERLQTEFDIDPESSSFLVPPLMIQTLIENGIKHGISKLTEGGIIQLKTKVTDDHLKIHIRNSGKFIFNGNRSKTGGGGLGLENTRQRLRLIYGDEASFRILTENDNFVLTEVIIPHLY